MFFLSSIRNSAVQVWQRHGVLPQDARRSEEQYNGFYSNTLISAQRLPLHGPLQTPFYVQRRELLGGQQIAPHAAPSLIRLQIREHTEINRGLAAALQEIHGIQEDAAQIDQGISADTAKLQTILAARSRRVAAIKQTLLVGALLGLTLEGVCRLLPRDMSLGNGLRCASIGVSLVTAVRLWALAQVQREPQAIDREERRLELDTLQHRMDLIVWFFHAYGLTEG